MADASKIEINGEVVNLKDATARENINTVNQAVEGMETNVNLLVANGVKASYSAETETITIQKIKQ